MKRLFLVFTILFCFTFANAQNPFEAYGYTPKIATLSNGKYNEFHDLDTIVQIGTVLFNTQTKQIVAFLQVDTLYSEATLQPDIVSMWMSPDPLASEYPSNSPYMYCLGNPIVFVDPDGRFVDWYKSEAGNVIWQPGSADKINVGGEEFSNIGTSYTSTVIGGDALVHYDQNTPSVIDLQSDVGKKYSMIAAEGGWIKQDGATKRETEYGLLIIGASMENRKNNSKYFPNQGTYESLFSPSQYNAANSRTYKNIAAQIPIWESWYGTADVMSYLDAVYKASHGNSVQMLQQNYNFANADKILGYAHNNSNLFGIYSVNLNFDKTMTLIKTVQSSKVVYPSLK